MGHRQGVLWWGLLALLALSQGVEAKTVRYELTADRGQVNLSGKKTIDFALMLNGSIPAPTLEFTEGDNAEILVRNRIPGEELSIHWHGILLPNEEDGVPYVTTPPIYSGKDHLFRFKIRQSGTYWYHSHTNVQEQKGLYGAFIIHPRKPTILADKEVVAVLSDWSDENATDILKNLRKDGDYYLYKKGTMRSWVGAIQAGGLGTYLSNEWTRMGGMDLSDVGYDAFLVNGKKDVQLLVARPGEKVRIRIINAAASSYFSVSLGQAPMKVISADGLDIAPIAAKEILMGMAETYDVLFEIPKHGNYELRATAQDGTGSASGWIGAGTKVAAPVKPFPDLYASMDHQGHGSGHEGHSRPEDGSGHGPHGHQGAFDTLTVDEIQAPAPTAFPPNARVHDVKLELGGDMRRYVWHINGKAIHEERTIEIQEGDVVRFTFVNTTMMHHPMHLHGHFFRVLNKHGASSPLKHTVDVPPHQTRTIEFLANEPGEWMLHCHNLFHLKTGMARVAKYSTFIPKKEIVPYQAHDPHLHDHWYFYGMLEAATNHGQARFRLSQTWTELEARMETRNPTGRNFAFDTPWEIEGDLLFRRWFGQYFNIGGGGAVFDKSAYAQVGVGYMLPFLIESEVFINHRGKFRLDLEKRFQWAKSVFSGIDLSWRPGQAHDLSEDVEFELSLMYSPSWSWSAGLMLTNDTLGAGMHLQF